MPSKKTTLSQKLFLKGDKLRAQGKFEAVLGAHAKGIAINPKNEKVGKIMGIALADMDRHEALKVFEKVLIHPS